MAKENYPFDLVDMANKDIREYGYRLRILIDEDEWYYNVEILTVDENDQITDVYEFAENMFESELADCVNDAWSNVRTRERLKEQRKTPRNVPDADSLYAKVCDALSHYEEIREGCTEEMYMALADVHDWMERNVINQ